MGAKKGEDICVKTPKERDGPRGPISTDTQTQFKLWMAPDVANRQQPWGNESGVVELSQSPSLRQSAAKGAKQKKEGKKEIFQALERVT